MLFKHIGNKYFILYFQVKCVFNILYAKQIGGLYKEELNWFKDEDLKQEEIDQLEIGLISDNNNDAISRNNSHFVAEKTNTVAKSINDNGPDAAMQSVEFSSRLLPTKQLAIDDTSASNCAENGTGNLWDRGNTSIDACGDYDTIHIANTDQVGDGALWNTVVEKMMDIDPHLQLFPIALGSGVLNGLVKAP